MPTHDRAPDRDERDHHEGADAATPASRARVGGARARRPVRRQRLPQAAGPRDKRDGTVAGVVGYQSDAGTGQSGADTRKRGWYWHWNSIVTQYAPLIGLKGVGLLNSYTVWTDRREESPYRGYAFPSQQREAAFYGEDRAELITINKILVALDLIEIRKEMVVRTDEKGRRWKVPHNFYRVKDQGDGFTLTTDAVRRVVELAERDAAVYRYVRRIFSAKFAPIDSTNVWHRILEELRPTEVWQRLAAKTEKTEKRASARSKAGHASRRAQADEGGFSLPEDGDTGTPERPQPATGNDTGPIGNDSGNDSGGTVVASTNTGSGADVEPANSGLDEKRPTSADVTNTDRPTSVQPRNSTYYQDSTTTTEKQESVRTQDDALPDTPPPPPSEPRDRALRQFEEANDRRANRAEQRILKMLAGDLRERAALSEPVSWEWIADAIDEAVASGSTYVAPKRIQEIVLRWSRDGRGDRSSGPQSQADRKPVTRRAPASHKLAQGAVTGESGGGQRSGRRSVPAPPRRGDPVRVAPFALPACGLTNQQVWSGVVDELERNGIVPRVDLDAWARLSMIVDADDAEVVVGVPNVLAERRAAGRYRSVLEAAVARVTGVRFAVRVIVGSGDADVEVEASGA